MLAAAVLSGDGCGACGVFGINNSRSVSMNKNVCSKCLGIVGLKKPEGTANPHKRYGGGGECSGAGLPVRIMDRGDLDDLRKPPLVKVGSRFQLPNTTIIVTSSAPGSCVVRDEAPIGKASWGFTRRKWAKLMKSATPLDVAARPAETVRTPRKSRAAQAP